MTKHVETLNKHKCSGCTACMAVCPKHCVKMHQDEEGFMYPIVDERYCIECGMCLKVCPFIKENYKRPLQAYDTPIVYAAKHRLNKVRLSSTSGGVFTAISDAVLSDGGVICGAVFDHKKKTVKHIIAYDQEQRNRMRGSKYVQSDLGNIFLDIKKLLCENTKVLFIGTPCQTAGLISFLNKDYDNLLVVDILCHSVPSPLIFHNAIDGKEINDICFRNKQKGWRNSYEFSIETPFGKEINTTYLNLFFKGLTNRPSCYNCRFTNTKRASDLTIGDYWNINHIDKSFEDNLGVSCILINSPKGMRYFNKITNQLYNIKTALTPALQECLKRPVTETYLRKEFWNNYYLHGYEWCLLKYGHKTIIDKIKDNLLVPVVKKLHIRTFVRYLRTRRL